LWSRHAADGGPQRVDAAIWESPSGRAGWARLEAGNISHSLPTLDKIAHALGAEVSLTIIDLDELTGAR
jgi:hypothetical protein